MHRVVALVGAPQASFELGCAADAAEEVDAFAGARVIDAPNGCEEAILEAGDIEL